MNLSPRQRSLAWLAVPVLAALFLLWFDARAIDRIEHISGQYATRPPADPESPTGYARGQRYLILADHNTESFQWVAQTQQMVADDTWRLREIDYDNAPRQRPVLSPSLYRWWLATLAKLNRDDDQPMGMAIEQSALIADPVLHFLLLGSVTLFIISRYGAFAGAMGALALTMMYPAVSAFYPGSPNDRGLAALFAAWSVLGLAAGISGVGGRWLFALSGMAAALGLWADPNRAVPVIGGIAIGGVVAAWLAKRDRVVPRQKKNAPPVPAATAALPWRIWAVSGALLSVGVYFLENAPDRLDLKALALDNNHPLYAVAWIGLGLTLARLSRWIELGREARSATAIVEFAVGLILLAALPVAMILTKQQGFLSGDAMSAQLSPLPGSERGAGFGGWLVNEGIRFSFWAVVLPLGFGIGAAWLVLQRALSAPHARSLVVAIGPLVVGLGFAFDQIAWWSTTGVLCAVVIAIFAGALTTERAQRIFVIALAVALLPSLARLLPVATSDHDQLTNADERSLAERDLGYWLATRIDEYRSVVLAPPESTPALHYYGGVRGLGSPYRGNDEGFGAAVRIASATSPDEAEALATQRELSHIILPTWDRFMDDYARLGAVQVDHTLVALLHNWLPPRWLRAVHHELPEIAGFDGQEAVIFEVVDVQDNATALSRLGEYFVESNQMDFASAIARTLEQSFPSDLGGLVARAQIAVAQSDRGSFERAIQSLLPYVEDERDGDLIWDRRVNLANILMLAQESDFALDQVQYCMDEVDEYLLRTVTPPSLYRFILLCRALDEPFPEDYLEAEALRLLPASLRDQLNAHP